MIQPRHPWACEDGEIGEVETEYLPATPDTIRKVMEDPDMQDRLTKYEQAEQEAAFACLTLLDVLERGYPHLVAKHIAEMLEKLER